MTTLHWHAFEPVNRPHLEAWLASEKTNADGFALFTALAGEASHQVGRLLGNPRAVDAYAREALGLVTDEAVCPGPQCTGGRYVFGGACWTCAGTGVVATAFRDSVMDALRLGRAA